MIYEPKIDSDGNDKRGLMPTITVEASRLVWDN